MRKIAPILLIALVLVAGCKKHYSFATDTNLVKTLSNQSNLPYEFYTYDATGRLTVDSNSQNNEVNKFFYSADTVTDSLYTNGVASLNTRYYLNAAGFAQKVTYDAQLLYYTYNNIGEQTIQVTYGDTIMSVWGNGDLLKQGLWGAGGTFIDSTVYTYLTTHDNRNFGQPYLGQASYHLLQHTSSGNLTYSYTFDSQGRVSAMIVHDQLGNSSTTNYTYY